MEKNTSMFKHSLTSGLTLGLALIIYTVLLYITNLTFVTGLGIVSYIIGIAGIWLGTKSYRDKVLDGSITYGQALGTGVLISVFAGVLVAIFVYILYKWIDPGLIDKMLKMSEDKLASRGMSDQQIEQAMTYSRKFTTPLISMIGSLISNAVFGTIISLITAAILKRDKNPMLTTEETN